MTFTTTEQRTEGKGKRKKVVEEKRDFEVEAGSHVYVSDGDFYAEWDSLTEKQQDAVLSVRDELSCAFGRARIALSLALELDGEFHSPKEFIARPYVPHKVTEAENRWVDAGGKGPVYP